MPIYTEKRSVFLFFLHLIWKKNFLAHHARRKTGKNKRGKNRNEKERKKKLELVWRKLFGIEKRTWRSTFIDCILTYSRLYPLPLFFFPSGFFCLSPLFSREQQLCGSISFPSFFVLLLLFCVSPLFYPNRRLRCHVVYNECKKRNNFIASLLPMISLSFAFRG